MEGNVRRSNAFVPAMAAVHSSNFWSWRPSLSQKAISTYHGSFVRGGIGPLGDKSNSQVSGHNPRQLSCT